MRYYRMIPMILMVLASCGPETSVSVRTPDVTIYATADMSTVLRIADGQFRDESFFGLNKSPNITSTISYFRSPDAACVSLDGVQIFGVPAVLREGEKFACGAARFEVVKCDFVEDCIDAQINAIWRTGVEPNFHELPVTYLYNKCRGVQSISFWPTLTVKLGTTLELRQGLGMLAQPNSKNCKRDLLDEFFGN